MATPETILEDAFRLTRNRLDSPVVQDSVIRGRIEYVARCLSNRAGARMLITCALAKIHRPEIDVRKPYTEISGDNSFSGRNDYDEAYVWPFCQKYNLPVNATTAFLTPGFRTINVPLAPPLVISGRPKRMYAETILLLDNVHHSRISAEELLTETLRQLVLLQQQQEDRLQQLLNELKNSGDSISLSTEDIVHLVKQHLNSPKSSRLPVLVVAAAYRAVANRLGETVKPLYAHNAADLQTGSLGDIEITLVDDKHVSTSYEMKAKEVTIDDIDLAVRKVASSQNRIDNYIFITTKAIDKDVFEYARSLYQETGGIEFAMLDCIGFLRHFLHLFHRSRFDFLEAYQELVLQEPDSAVSQPLKEVFLSLRRAAELDNSV